MFIGSGTFSEGLVPFFSTTKYFVTLVPEKESVFRQGFDPQQRPSTKWYCSQTNFLLLGVFGSNRQRHHNHLGILFLKFRPTALARKTLSFLGSKVYKGLQQEVIDDQGWRSKKNCQKTAPKHQLDLHKRATAQVLLSAHANPEVVPSPESTGLLGLLTFA